MAPQKTTISLENYILQIQLLKVSGSFIKAMQEMEGKKIYQILVGTESL